MFLDFIYIKKLPFYGVKKGRDFLSFYSNSKYTANGSIIISFNDLPLNPSSTSNNGFIIVIAISLIFALSSFISSVCIITSFFKVCVAIPKTVTFASVALDSFLIKYASSS